MNLPASVAEMNLVVPMKNKVELSGQNADYADFVQIFQAFLQLRSLFQEFMSSNFIEMADVVSLRKAIRNVGNDKVTAND